MATEQGVYVSPSGQKAFVPLENNPRVLAQLARDLGVSQELGFYDIYSVDDADALAQAPRPALALIVIAPPAAYGAVRAADAAPGQAYDGSGDAEPVLWFRQTIGNACGLVALLHAVANGEARGLVRPGSVLDALLAEATPLKPAPRAAALYASPALERAHMRAARLGSTPAPRADEQAHHHFLAFVRGRDGHLWELEGGVDGPIDRGPLAEGEDMLSEGALARGVKRFLRHAEGSLAFSIVALARTAAL